MKTRTTFMGWILTAAGRLLFVGLLFAEVAAVTPNCTEHLDNCQWWASVGECINNPSFMWCNCSVSCNTPAFCIENSNDGGCFCGHVAKSNRCGTYPSCADTCANRTAITCPEPPEVANAVAVGGRSYLDVVNYLCLPGYVNTGGQGCIGCNITGNWVSMTFSYGAAPQCVATSRGKYGRFRRTDVTDVEVKLSLIGTYDVISKMDCALHCLSLTTCQYFVIQPPPFVTSLCRAYEGTAGVSNSANVTDDLWVKIE